jgi:post-segregation antitoxin (ccd killing protein)
MSVSLTLRVPTEIRVQARSAGLNLSQVCRNAIFEAVKKLEQNPKRTIASAKIPTVRREKTQSQME